MDYSFTVHHVNMQSLAIELFKVGQNILTDMLSTIFQMRDNIRYNLRSQTEFLRFLRVSKWFELPKSV